MTLKVLIVDANEDDRIAMRFALHREDWEIETAANTAKARLAAELFRPDVIVLDYSIQNSNGIEFFGNLKEHRGAEPLPSFVMVTGVGSELVAAQALRAGASDYVIKDAAGDYLKLLPAVLERVGRARQDLLVRQEQECHLHIAANVFGNISEGILVTDTAGMILSVNPALLAITGYSQDEVIGATPRLFKSNRHEPLFYRDMWRQLIHDGQWRGELWNRRKDGAVFLSRQTITAILDDNGERRHYVSVMSDVTECRALDDQMKHRAYHDELTELPNRCLLLDRLRQQLAYAQRHGRQVAVLFIDLDNFKPVNDELGHENGDELLRQAAQRLRQGIRESDTVARWGGDEFIALLADLDDRHHAAQVAEKIVAQVGEPYSVGGYQIRISASIGIALYPANGDEVGLLVKAADNAMYAAKKVGGGTYRLADQPT